MRVCLIAFLALFLPSSAMAQPAERPSLSEIWQANKMRQVDLDTLDPAFDAWRASEGTDYQTYPEQLGRLRNRPAYDVWTSEIDRERQDRRTLGSDG